MTAKAVLAISGALGFIVVAYGFPDWQVAVETAQVTAGIVEYPRGTPFYIYHLKLWTILHQAAALLLAAGLSEITVSVLVSGVMGMVTFQALAMAVYALSRDAVLSVTSVVAIIASNTANIGATYPIELLGTSHTYGMLGLALVVLVGGLLGAGEHGLGLFLLGLAPAVHPSLGIWLALIVGASLACDRQSSRVLAVRSWRYFAAGCAVSAISLAIHVMTSRGIPPVPAEVSSRYLVSFTGFWDGHRQPVAFDAMGVRLNLGALALALIVLTLQKVQKGAASFPGKEAAILVRFIAVSALGSVAAVFLSRVAPDRVPAALLILMPTRVLNVDAMLFAPLVIGLVGTFGRYWWGRWSTAVLLVGLLVGRRSMLWPLLEQRGVGVENPRLDSIGVLVVAAVAYALTASCLSLRRPVSAAGAPRGSFPVADGVNVLLAAAMLWIGAGPALARDEHATLLRDRTNDVLFGAVARGRGLLLTGGDLHLIQLRTRRPVLLDGGGLDGLAYAREAAPAMDRILRDVYGVDLFAPPEEARFRGTVPPDFNRQVWQRYSRERWQQIKADYNVSQVLVPSDWALELPITAQSRRYLLYDIP